MYSSTHKNLDVGEWLVSRPGRFTLGERVLVFIGYECGWAPEPVWARWGIEPCPSARSLVN
jgi:hypothetical protein